MQKYTKKAEQDEEDGEDSGNGPVKLIFFDFETTQDTRVGEGVLGPINLHKVNLCVVQRACDLCKDKSMEEKRMQGLWQEAADFQGVK